MINGKKPDIRNEMYLKYKKSSIFNETHEGNPSQITTKVNEKRYNAKFEPKYNENNAREQYIKQFWQKDPQCFPKKTRNSTLNKSLYIKKQLNANEIMCRDMYSNCNPKEYQIRRSKSSFTKRSKGYLDQPTTNNTIRNSNANGIEMNSKERFVDSLQSNIFFATESNNSNKNNNSNSNNAQENNDRISIYPQDNEALSQTKIPKSRITHSKLTSNFDWKYVNTEISSGRLSLNGFNSHNNTNHLNKHSTKANNDITQRRRHSYLDPNQKENFINLNSVQYDIITHQEGIASKNGIPKLVNGKSKEKVANGILSVKAQKKVQNGSSSRGTNSIIKNGYKKDNNIRTEEYQIDVPKEFEKINLKEIKNMFYSVGIHLYKCETKGSSLSNRSGKIIFKVRKDINDNEYLGKIENINSKIANNRMALNKTSRNTLRPITELVSVKEKILVGFKDKAIEKRLKRSQTPGSELKPADLTPNGNGNEVSKNTCRNSLRNSNIQYDNKFKNHSVYTKTQEKAFLTHT